MPMNAEPSPHGWLENYEQDKRGSPLGKWEIPWAERISNNEVLKSNRKTNSNQNQEKTTL